MNFLLELDGVSAGDVKNIQGGGAVAEVVQQTFGADHIVRKKHIGAVHYDDIVLTCGAGLSRAFYGAMIRKTMVEMYCESIRFSASSTG